ncbi:MAG: hypothetical protein ACLQVG_28500 [Terriglobia bacterium]
MTSCGLVTPASYDYHLVILSILIFTLAGWAALDLAGRVAAARGGARLAWLIGGATAMTEIWAAFDEPIRQVHEWGGEIP